MSETDIGQVALRATSADHPATGELGSKSVTTPVSAQEAALFSQEELKPTPEMKVRLDALVDQFTLSRVKTAGVTDPDLIQEMRRNVRRHIYRTYRPYAASRALGRRTTGNVVTNGDD